MTKRQRSIAFLVAGVLAAAVTTHTQAASQAGAVRPIPGITAKDAFPNGCVDCHLVVKDGDMRMSTLMATWTKAVPEPLLAKTRAASADASKIKGKHPALPNVKTNIPQTCLGCHKKGSTIAPPFSQLLHTIHLVGGAQNKFVTMFQGECTHCHKLDQKTGAWKVATAAEK